jgi:hypothetical protein
MEEEARFIGLERLKMFSVAEEAGVEPEVVCEKDVVKGAKKKTQKKK